MKFVVAALLAAALAACTRPNPRSCLDGVCSDPAYPFCDTQGTLGGIQFECIAVSCEPLAFAECRDRVSVTCNPTGDNYQTTTCERVCTVENDGCRLCDPNQTACTNDVLATCNEVGEVTQSNPCALGCEDASRCRSLRPSNELDTYLDMVSSPADLILDDVTIDTVTGTFNGEIEVESFLMPAPMNGVPVRVFIARSVTLRNVTVVASNGTTPALAIVATEGLEVAGPISFPTSGLAAGQFSGDQCDAMQAAGYFDGVSSTYSGGGGGNGFGTSGGAGGAAGDVTKAMGGSASGNANLTPLRGGCSIGAKGGGALQLVSLREISVSGRIDVRGGPGFHGSGDGGDGHIYTAANGGGSGGGILLEAPTVSLASTARLLATGGSGASGDEDGVITADGTPALGAAVTTTTKYGAGGAAAGTKPALTEAMGGSDFAGTCPINSACAGGGGGGGLGRIRINTKDGQVAGDASALVAGTLTTGNVLTR